MHKNVKGQSTFEYIILLAAVIVLLLVFLSPAGPFKRTVEGTLNGSVDSIGIILQNTTFPR
ncbi:MAG TPA: hypothetical protein PL155_06655 [Candidatus Omnitrophota bacterium]|nr:hypothetical protein [Candidatus Omnitrophota bacterium]HPD83841.1 hypothetical protein [Candidatus Omnitrophota bacterium]HRZ02698.1 hypothetical protein [Candidatus Omnitrophota bacterium]